MANTISMARLIFIYPVSQRPQELQPAEVDEMFVPVFRVSAVDAFLATTASKQSVIRLDNLQEHQVEPSHSFLQKESVNSLRFPERLSHEYAGVSVSHLYL